LDDTTEEEETETFAPTAFAGAKTADSLSNRVSFWNSSVVAAAALHDAEASVALDIALRLQKPKRDPDVPRVRRWLQAAATKEGWRLLSPAQEAFLDLALREPISVLTGGPGTGKTFATHIAVRLWRAMGKNVLMCAPTGRAAQRLAEIASAGRNMSAPVQSSTIHRLLEYGGGARANNNDDRDGHDTHQNSESHDELTYKDKFARNVQNPLDADIVVVDESSMLDLPLCAALLDAIKQNAQVSSVFFGRRTTVCLYYYLLDLQYYPDFEPTTSTTLVVRLTTLTLP
jgi:exodeoxyribonuclease V alpha subunit